MENLPRRSAEDIILLGRDQQTTHAATISVDYAMAKKTFEAALSRLEEITRELEEGDLSLESSLKKFDEGIQLADYCNMKLSEAKAKVEILLKKDGALKAQPFEEAERGNQELSE